MPTRNCGQAGSENVTKTIDGGDPIYLDSPITLCGRADKDPERAFTGRLTALTIFDDALSPAQVPPIATIGYCCTINVSAQTEILVLPCKALCRATYFAKRYVVVRFDGLD